MMFTLLAYTTSQRNWAIAVAVVLLVVVLGRRNEARTKAAAISALSDSGFDTVAGCDEAVADLREIVAFLREPTRFERLGAKVPKGALLVGPPGTGKTLLARAVAAEAGVPFHPASATDFVEMYVGVGAKRIRELYERARSSGPSIVFIDEIDAIGRARSMNDRENGTPGGPIEHENTLIALLTELDGFAASEVITIAATNRPDVLDPAIIRPGRLERRVEVPLPDLAGREQILAVHATGKPLTDDVDFAAIARRTPGFSGADLSRVCNEAALEGVRRALDAVDHRCFDAAVELVAMGRPRFSAVISDKDRKITAWHEAGHAICGLVQADAPDPVAVSITPRGHAAGITWFEATDAVFVSKEAAFAQLVVALGGRVAEEMLMGGSCTQGAQGDLRTATDLATKMVASFGFAGSLVSRRPSALGDLDEFTDREVDSLLDDAHATAVELLGTHTAELEQVANLLLERDRLDLADLRGIFPTSARPVSRVSSRVSRTAHSVAPVVSAKTSSPNASHVRPARRSLETLRQLLRRSRNRRLG